MTGYQKYQLQWMIDHDCSLTEMLSEMNTLQQDGFDGDVVDLFNEWEFSHGFGGEIWACEEEWNDCKEESAMKIKREINGQEVEITLTDAEMESLYDEARKLHMFDWITNLLEEYEYPEQNPEVVERITEIYMDRMERGDRLGELEHDVFEYVMENDFPEIEVKEE